MKSVKIPEELFYDLVRYFILEDTSQERSRAITDVLNAKIDNLVKHDLYTTYKTAETSQEREEARKKYLDSVGVHKDFRW